MVAPAGFPPAKVLTSLGLFKADGGGLFGIASAVNEFC